MKFQSVDPRGLDRAEARRHQLGGRDLVHALDADGAAGAVRRPDRHPDRRSSSIGIMNTMWIAIRERTREIGTLRAIGMQRRAVLWMFLLEALHARPRRHAVRRARRPRRSRPASTRPHIPVPSGLQFFLHVADACTSSVHGSCVVQLGRDHHRRAPRWPPFPLAPRRAAAPGRRHVPLRMNAMFMKDRTRSLASRIRSLALRSSRLAAARSPRCDEARWSSS